MNTDTTNTQPLKAIFLDFPTHTNWVSGVYGNYSFHAKLFDTGSDFGINGGRVSKLSISNGKTLIVNYERGWDIEPVMQEKHAYDAIMNLLENSPKRFEK